VVGLLTGTRIFLALAYTGFFLNLFNMVPMPPLDGGRVATVFSPRAWILGAVVLGGMFLVTGAPQLALIGLLALTHMRRRPAAPALAGQAAFGGQAGAPQVEPVPDEVRTRWTVRYFGLCFFLGAAIFFTQRLLNPVAGP
jgi:Zn-dependent protease